MKVLHVITSLRTGGAERLVTDLLPRFRDNGLDVSLLLFDGTGTPYRTELEEAGIRVLALSKGRLAMRDPFLLFPLSAHLRRHRYDIVHTHNTSCQLLVALASGAARSVLVTTEHNTSNRRRGWGWFAPLDRRMYRQYDRIICVGDETERALNAYLPSTRGKTMVITNGIDLGRIEGSAPSEDVRRTDGFKILMVAAFRAQKDHATMIRAMRSLPDTYTLFLAGGAETREDERTMQECIALSESLGLRERVRFLGVRHDVPGLMAASDVLVLSSHYEGNPLSAMEAMSSGKPVIASDVPGLSGVVGGAGLLFAHGDAESLAGMIRRVCEDKEEASGVAAACLLRSKEYDIDRTVRSYMDVYRKLINN